MNEQKMWLSDLSIRQPVFITMVVSAVVVVGALLYSRMGLDLLPDVSLPIVAVQTVYPGASPEAVERDITKPIEDAIASLNGVDRLRSTSSDSTSTVIVQFQIEKDAKEAFEEVRARVEAIQNSLPSDARDPLVLRFDPGATPILSFAVADRGGRSPQELRSLVDNTLKPRFERVDGVAAVTVSGGKVREIHVDLKLDRLLAFGLAPQQVLSALRSENSNVPGGRLTEKDREVLLRTVGEFRSVAEISEVPVVTSRGTTVKVKEVATVTEGFADLRTFSRLDGRESVVATVQKQSGTNTVAVADAIKRELERIRQDYPDLDLVVATDRSVFTRDAIHDLQTALLLGGLLAAATVLLFFRDLRNTLVTVAGLPVIVLGTFAVMNALGMGLNMVTMMALSLSIGFLIDDAIVVRENIFRHMEHGEEPKVAAQRATAEIALAVVAVTSTIVAVFLPVAFMGGIVGKFMRDFGLTVAVAVVISLIEAFTLAPMLSAYFLKALDHRGQEAKRRQGGLGPLDRGYRRLLGWALHHRLIVVAGGIAIFIAGMAIIPLLPTIFTNEPDYGEFSITLELPPGATLSDTDKATRRVEQILFALPEVERVFPSVGSAEGGVEKAVVSVKLKERGRTADLLARLRPQLERAVGSEAQVTTERRAMFASSDSSGISGALSGRPIQITVQGANFADLDRVSQTLVERLRQVPGIIDVERSLKPAKPGLDIVVDRARATDLGVSTLQVGGIVRVLVNGEVASGFRASGENIDIIVRLQETDRANQADMLRLPLLTSRGTQVPLSSVAGLIPTRQPVQIERRDRQRQILVGADSLGRDQAAVIADAQTVIAALQSALPSGVTLSFVGEIEEMNQAFAALLLALALSVLFVYMILASQFGSFIHPFTIMLALPFSGVGALLALLVTGKNLDMMGMIGIILLVGLVTKNSILLVDFAIKAHRRGLSAREAMLEAGPIRLRPILMTTLAMIFGMSPVAVGLGAGAELRQNMGVAVIGGLVLSTLLTLVVVPVGYTMVMDLEQWVRQRRRRMVPTPAMIEEGVAATGMAPSDDPR